MFVRVNAIFNTWGVILHEGRIGGLQYRSAKFKFPLPDLAIYVIQFFKYRP